MLIKLFVPNCVSEECSSTLRVYRIATLKCTAHEDPSLMEFSTNNFINILYFNKYFKPYI